VWVGYFVSPSLKIIQVFTLSPQNQFHPSLKKSSYLNNISAFCPPQKQTSCAASSTAPRIILTAPDYPCASNPCARTPATPTASSAARSSAGMAEGTRPADDVFQPPPASLHKRKTLRVHFTVASLQTVHLTTCWCSFPSKLMSDWHTRQFITGTPLASGLAMAVYGGGSSAARDQEISAEKPTGDPRTPSANIVSM